MVGTSGQPFRLVLKRFGDLPDMAPAAVKTLACEWFQALDITGTVPDRRRFDPVRHLKLSPWLYLAEWVDDQDVYVRFAGDHYRVHYGQEITGKRLSALVADTDQARPLRCDLATVRDEARPVFRRAVMDWRHGRPPVGFERLMLPLNKHGDGERGEAPKLVLGLAFFYREPGWPWP